MTDGSAAPGSRPLVRAEPLAVLRRRTSEKWVAHPDDVLPMFVAEMDYPLAPVVQRALGERIAASDTGYHADAAPVAHAFAGFAARRWGWSVDPAGVTTTTDVSVAVVETLRRVLAPGDGVIVMPPVYPPFWGFVEEAGGTVVEVPLLGPDAGGDGATATDDGAIAADADEADSGPASSTIPAADWSMDLAGIERALAAGARAILLCNPHNPLGLVHPRDELERLAELALAHDAVVVSDEIHGPLTRACVDFTPFLSVSDAAREIGIATPSASKAFNLAGVKCALIVAQSTRGRAVLAGLPEEVLWRTSILGAAATRAAYAEGDDWLDGTVAAIADSRAVLTEALPRILPGAVLHSPDASYVAWIDLRGAGFGDEPAPRILTEAKVALSPGVEFSRDRREGAGFVRMNIACDPALIVEALTRIARLPR
ncbi:MalY/PatB family protein [Schumannella sp. 10F1B-5-1]|uniref:MalY/PatB family protein n=1 Tax=Schumannella sp. 10F1B-5-1 TaxID=2590780 RepID=UPI00113212A9|nr:aminotransferase class I/II-fold pyridoxal phosphate-dependent enzyme [Schumannella sp. 10F1B-5-1]TPW71729.1 aminotransferase class I/II-fold pyridoxal phosphate-dependent enzyme [Schumannella sp. 10F1B-5-1]